MSMSEAQPGHNGQLKSIVERVENLNEQIKELGSDRSDIFAEAKGNGYDVKALRKVIAIRKIDPTARAEQGALVETYLAALGMEA
jgi:uncharacterized protein (UPF0335 family)